MEKFIDTPPNTLAINEFIQQYSGFKYAIRLGYIERKMLYDFCEMSDDVQIINKLFDGNIFDYEELEEYVTFGKVQFTYKSIDMMFCMLPCDLKNTATQTSIYVCSNDIEALRDMCTNLENNNLARPGTIKIFDAGHWSTIENSELKDYTWDSIILPADVKNKLIKSTEAFLSGRMKDIYKELSIPYQRGFIFIGPPGCGKTLTTKIIANVYNIPVIYVKGVNYAFDFNTIYAMAEKSAPCVVLLEDIDGMVNQPNFKTRFLNVLNGLLSYQEILTIATTNYPEKLDSALLKRPSRFDVKIVFSPPSKDVKILYLNEKLAKIYRSGVSRCEEEIKYISENSNKFTFTMLQEMIILASYDNKTYKTPLKKSLLTAFEQMKQQFNTDCSNMTIDDMEDCTLGFRSRK